MMITIGINNAQLIILKKIEWQKLQMIIKQRKYY